MKKTLTIVTTTLALVLTLIVGSFAWYKMYNNGQLSVDIGTQVKDGITLTITPFSKIDGSLAPSKMKKGVINNYEDYYITGNPNLDDVKNNENLIKIPTSEEVLPLVKTITDPLGNPLYYQYDLNEDKTLKAGSEYLETPATILYRQFELRLGSIESTTKIASFDIKIEYYDIFNKLAAFKQSDAISFSFYILEGHSIPQEGLTSLSTISSFSSGGNKDNSSKKTLSEYLYTYNQSASEENKYKLSTFVNEGGKVFNYSRGEEWNTSNFYNYRVNPFIVNTDEGFTMNFELVGLDMNISYYVLIELFYNLPDELLDGALSLTERLNLEISYAITSQFDEK